MVLTPADVHNIAFSRPRIGKRGYNEQEVDLFIDLVEQELIRHLEAEGELRSCNAELRGRDGGLQKREVVLCQREASLHQHECEVHRHEEQLRQQEMQLSQRAAQLAKQGTPLPQQVAQLRYREAQVAQREAQIAQHEAGLAQHEGELRRQEAELGQWENELREHDAERERQEAKLAQRQAQLDQREAELREEQADLRRRLKHQEEVAACVGAESARKQAARSPRPAQQLRAVPKPTAVNGGSRPSQERVVAAVHGRHDMERMAIRAVTDTLGNMVAETVHERTRRSTLDDGGPGAAYDRTELDLLKEENADLTRSLGMLKAAAALLAAALEQT